MGKLWRNYTIWIIFCFSLLAPVKNVEEQWAKLAPSNVKGLQHCIGEWANFKRTF